AAGMEVEGRELSRIAQDGRLVQAVALPEISLTRAQRAADVVTEFFGSWTFVIVFSVLTFGWIDANSLPLFTPVWDPYPYILLNLALTVISTFQSPLI